MSENVEKVVLTEQQKDDLICAMFKVKIASEISRGALHSAIIKQHNLIQHFGNQLQQMTIELYCENPKHAIFLNVPAEILAKYEEVRTARNKGKIVIPKIILGK